jgi:hypothetical protein
MHRDSGGAWHAFGGRSWIALCGLKFNGPAMEPLDFTPGQRWCEKCSNAVTVAIPAASPTLELHVVESTNRHGQLSLRISPESETWTPVFRAMNALGFQPGDVVRLTVVRR